MRTSSCSVIRCSDENEAGALAFDKSKATLPEALAARVEYEGGSAAGAVRRGDALGCDVLLVDPPRKGLDPSVLASLCEKPFVHAGREKKPRRGGGAELDDDFDDADDEGGELGRCADIARIVYVSCGVPSLLNDIAALRKSGEWRLVHAEGHVLFVGADHVESVVVLDRVVGAVA